jgi:hypothetical protein
MTRRVSMPSGEEATRSAALEQMRELLHAVSCALRLLARTTDSARDDAIIRSMKQSLRRAEWTLNRFPSPTDP